jgi:hypothetical protein
MRLGRRCPRKPRHTTAAEAGTATGVIAMPATVVATCYRWWRPDGIVEYGAPIRWFPARHSLCEGRSAVAATARATGMPWPRPRQPSIRSPWRSRRSCQHHRRTDYGFALLPALRLSMNTDVPRVAAPMTLRRQRCPTGCSFSSSLPSPDDHPTGSGLFRTIWGVLRPAQVAWLRRRFHLVPKGEVY